MKTEVIFTRSSKKDSELRQIITEKSDKKPYFDLIKKLFIFFKNAIDKTKNVWYNNGVAGMAQSVEHVIGNDEVISSILITSSNPRTLSSDFSFYILLGKYKFLLTIQE